MKTTATVRRAAEWEDATLLIDLCDGEKCSVVRRESGDIWLAIHNISPEAIAQLGEALIRGGRTPRIV